MPTIRKGFTLIELLVVIAIIAILAAILFPVFAQAKLQAKKAADLSNYKQATLALLMYTNDSDDTYPLSTFWDDTFTLPFTTGYSWSSAWCVQPYIKNLGIYDCPVDPNQSTYNAAYYGIDPSRVTAFQSFQSNAITPAYTMFISAKYPTGVPNPQGLMPDPISMPPCSFYGSCTADTTTTTTSVPKPSTIVLLAGGNNELYGKFWGCGPWIQNEIDWCYTGYGISDEWKIDLMVFTVPTDPWYYGWRKFALKSNYSFSDGHAKTLSPGDMTDPARWVINPPANDNFGG
ncbi:MAG TPA: prepilin-type N-terminal cleavage/methylation domain-containing protein [Fimbriimonadaceae bacterium]|nr:prepilin-type N-terminal cleavage/methylation domain-containing protein [Fimbriimonadaceae bacterium]